MSIEQFKVIMSYLQQQIDHDEKATDSFKHILRNDWISGYDNSNIYKALFSSLECIFNDTDNKWIEYFVCDLEMGSKYRQGCVRINGKDFNLSTVDDLYILLTGDSEK